MELSIYQCDKCKADCSAYENRVVVNFPYGETKHLCLDCATKVFEKEESEVK
jgi:hypothetical protein